MRVRRPLAIGPLVGLLALWLPSAAAASDAVWNLLRGGGQVVLMRHAVTTPGVGDPAGFRLDDCATQRNLTGAGREEARRVGAAFRARDIPVGRVLSSRWCRCLETARLAFGRAEAWADGLDSLFEERAKDRERTATLRRFVSTRPTSGNLVLVTHGANIRSLTGIQPAPGELVVLTPGGSDFRVSGRIAPAALE